MLEQESPCGIRCPPHDKHSCHRNGDHVGSVDSLESGDRRVGACRDPLESWTVASGARSARTTRPIGQSGGRAFGERPAAGRGAAGSSSDAARLRGDRGRRHPVRAVGGRIGRHGHADPPRRRDAATDVPGLALSAAGAVSGHDSVLVHAAEVLSHRARILPLGFAGWTGLVRAAMAGRRSSLLVASRGVDRNFGTGGLVRAAASRIDGSAIGRRPASLEKSGDDRQRDLLGPPGGLDRDVGDADRARGAVARIVAAGCGRQWRPRTSRRRPSMDPAAGSRGNAGQLRPAAWRATYAGAGLGQRNVACTAGHNLAADGPIVPAGRGVDESLGGRLSARDIERSDRRHGHDRLRPLGHLAVPNVR